MNFVNPSATLGDHLTMGNCVIIGEGAWIGKNVTLGNNVVIHANSCIGDNVRIDDNVVVGKLPMRAATSANPSSGELPGARIGSGCLIGTNAIIYRGADIGHNCLIADLATIRENVSIGHKTIVGRNVAIENNCQIGNFCKLETNCYITAWSDLGNHVFVAPGVMTSNDNYAGRSQERLSKFRGVIIRYGGRVGVNATILPGKEIGEQGFVGAGSVVTRDVPARKIVIGNPAKVIGDVPVDQLLTPEDIE